MARLPTRALEATEAAAAAEAAAARSSPAPGTGGRAPAADSALGAFLATAGARNGAFGRCAPTLPRATAAESGAMAAKSQSRKASKRQRPLRAQKFASLAIALRSKVSWYSSVGMSAGAARV